MLHNLREYHRPADLDEATRLLQRKEVYTVAVAGGVGVMGSASSRIEAVVDLADLGLGFIERESELLHIGATVRLQTLVEQLGDIADGLLADAARRTAGLNIRNMATIGGLLAGGAVHSPLSVVLAALLARVRIYQRSGEVPYWPDVTKEVRVQGLKGQIITAVSINLPGGAVHGGYAQAGRTPADQPIVSAASVAYQRENGDVPTFTAVGGLQHDLIVVGQVIPISEVPAYIVKVSEAVVDARAPEAAFQDDFLGSAAYRKGIAPVLAARALESALRNAGIDVA